MKTSTASILGLIYVLSEAAIAANHRLVDTGPYRIVRHPSYTGALMAFLGLALCLANWASLNYMERTKRLVPGVY
jgi:protein-S-isoprenylcysteine O-methyltransferase Ste14